MNIIITYFQLEATWSNFKCSQLVQAPHSPLLFLSTPSYFCSPSFIVNFFCHSRSLSLSLVLSFFLILILTQPLSVSLSHARTHAHTHAHFLSHLHLSYWKSLTAQQQLWVGLEKQVAKYQVRKGENLIFWGGRAVWGVYLVNNFSLFL